MKKYYIFLTEYAPHGVTPVMIMGPFDHPDYAKNYWQDMKKAGNQYHCLGITEISPIDKDVVE